MLIQGSTLLLSLALTAIGPLKAAESGEQLFLDNCAECHQAHGRGIDGIYPALAGNETVLGSGIDVALVMMIGRGEMPTFKEAFTADQFSTIINYVRNSWGNSGAPVTADQIESLLQQDGN